MHRREMASENSGKDWAEDRWNEREREISYDDVALISLLNDPSSISFLPNYRFVQTCDPSFIILS